MSIVEKALSKLHEKAAAAREAAAPVASALRLAGATPSGDPPAARSAPVQIGNPAKQVRVDFDRLRQNHMLPPEHQRRQLSHQYRTLKRPLIKYALENKAHGPHAASSRSIMVTSALPGDGKTFTSINLAISLSLERDHNVLLVDGDVPKPHVSRTFNVQDEPGLLDVLSDPSLPIESVILPTDMRNFSLLPVGRRGETATELLSSSRMRQVLARLEQLDPNLLIVLDSPPVLFTSEARVLSSQFGQVVLVVKAGGTPQQAVLDTLAIIGDGPRVGLVLNQTIHGNGAEGNYYGYYYGYGDQAGAKSAGEPDSASLSSEEE